MKKVIISVFIFFVWVAIPAQINKDSLLAIWENKNLHDTIRIEAINTLGQLLNYTQPDSALKYINIGLKYAVLSNHHKSIADSYYNFGLHYRQLSNYKMAIVYIEKSIFSYQKINEQNGIFKCNMQFAVINALLGNYNKAINFSQNNIQLSLKLNDNDKLINCYQILGGCYFKMSDRFKKINYLDSAKKYYEECLSIANKENNLKAIAEAHGNLSELYFDLKNYDLSQYHIFKALSIFKRNKNKYRTAMTFNFIGSINRIKKDYGLSKVYIDSSLDISKKYNFKRVEADSYSELYEINKTLKNHKSALIYYEIYHKLNDSLKDITNQKMIIEQEYKLNYLNKSIADSIYNAEEKKIKHLEYEARLNKERTVRYSILGVLAAIFAFSFLLYHRFRVTKRQNKIIKIQKKQVDKAFKELDIQSQKIEQKNKEVLASINYASKIQDTILPNTDEIKSYFKNLFVLYQPKDIVGGDFYWYRSFAEISVIATVDCTGHGVPGGFMSMMGSLLLDKIVDENKLNTGDILKELNNEIVRVLDQKSGGVIQDGMDIALCVFNTENRTLSFSGARNGIMILKNNQVRYFDAEIFSVGGSYSKKSQLLKRDFKTHSIELNKNDWVFMYTDGYYDQLGGKDITSMGMKLFQDNLMDSLSAVESKDVFLMNKFNSWKGDLPQIDDILVLGFQV